MDKIKREYKNQDLELTDDQVERISDNLANLFFEMFKREAISKKKEIFEPNTNLTKHANTIQQLF